RDYLKNPFACEGVFYFTCTPTCVIKVRLCTNHNAFVQMEEEELINTPKNILPCRSKAGGHGIPGSGFHNPP
ncbi:MAG TPA: hypothetical protein PLT63_10235, partial [Syntrophales bacterium]|nr:hypothetical protein [Syntrophales bacterium]